MKYLSIISHLSCSCRAEKDSKIAIESFSYDCVLIGWQAYRGDQIHRKTCST